MNWIEQLVKAILDWITRSFKTDLTSEDSKSNDALKNSLLTSISESERLRESSNLCAARPTCATCGERQGSCLCT